MTAGMLPAAGGMTAGVLSAAGCMTAGVLSAAGGMTAGVLSAAGGMTAGVLSTACCIAARQGASETTLSVIRRQCLCGCCQSTAEADVGRMGGSDFLCMFVLWL